MNTAMIDEPSSKPMSQIGGQESNEFEYRSVSKAAVASIAFTIMGLLTAYLAQPFVILPALGVIFGYLAFLNFRRFPEELSGRPAAKFGFIISLFVLITSFGYHSYIYATEVPDGHIRMSFSDLRPNPKTPSIPYAQRAEELDGQKVFLKGYVRPGAKKRKLKEFILVGDFGDCCFGGNPSPTDIVAVSIIGDDTVDYGYSLRRISGTFRLNKHSRPTNEDDIPQVYYEIHTEQVR